MSASVVLEFMQRGSTQLSRHCDVVRTAELLCHASRDGVYEGSLKSFDAEEQLRVVVQDACNLDLLTDLCVPVEIQVHEDGLWSIGVGHAAAIVGQGFGVRVEAATEFRHA